MTKKSVGCLALAILFAPLVCGQKWEFGGGVGVGYYPSQDVKNPAATGSVRIVAGLAASAWLDNNTSRLWGGELRYDYQMGDFQVSSQSNKAAFGAQTHGIHYDFLLHAAGRDSKIRPFIAFGGGVKLYQGTGTEVLSQPLNNLALLTKTSDTRAMGSVGAGVKINTGRFGFRFEVHDYITPFPNKVIAPAQNAKLGGFLHDLVASFGLSLLF
jgi:hypothetical protein